MAKKHKKRVYSNPKKIKHRNQITPLMSFINSLSNPKCPLCQSILAGHFNRNYCGKCQISHSV